MKTIVLTSLLLSSALLSFSAQSQSMNNQYQHYSKPIRHYQAPKPITGEALKNRLDHQLAIIKRQMAFDKKQAENYAENFARYQKQQANVLKQMMAQAEKQRQFTIKKLEMQQQNILERFAKYQVAKDSTK